MDLSEFKILLLRFGNASQTSKPGGQAGPAYLGRTIEVTGRIHSLAVAQHFKVYVGPSGASG